MPNSQSFSIKKVYFIDFLIFLALLAIDQWTKWLAVTKLKGADAFVLIPRVLEFDYLENNGSAFSMFAGKKVFILILCFLLLSFLIYALFRLPQEKKFIWLHFCIAAIVSGGIGNMIDRFRLGYVVDYISFVLIHFPVFNFADIAVVVAVIFLFLLILFVYKEDDLEQIHLFGRK